MTLFRSNLKTGIQHNRIVSLVPSLTETIIDLGAGNKLVGRTKFCVEPKGLVEDIPRIGGTKNIHIDKVISLQPDLILATREENDKASVETLMRDFPVCVYDIQVLGDALDMILHLGSELQCLQAAKKMCRKIESEFNDLKAPAKPRSAAYLIWDEPMMVSGGDTFINHMMSHAGYQNAFSSYQRYPEITADMLRELSPSTILLSSEPFPFKDKHILKYQEMLPESNILLVDGTYFSWYGSRLVRSPGYFRAKCRVRSAKG